MKLFKLFLLLLMFQCLSCNDVGTNKSSETFQSIKSKHQSLIFTDGFDFPIGKPDGKNYYNAQVFGENWHLGDDWNGVHGKNSDLGDPIFTIANGYVSFSADVGGGWGNVIRIVHHINDLKSVESLYAHCKTIRIKKGQFVKKGQEIGTIGNANGQYYAHLHFEIRDRVNMPIGNGYSKNTTRYLNPTNFIKSNRR